MHFAFHKMMHDSAMQPTWLFECSQLLLYRNPCEIIRKDYLSILRKRDVNGGKTSGCFVIIFSKKEQTPKQNHLFFQDSSQKGHQCLITGQEEQNFMSAPVLSIPPSPIFFLPADHLALGNTLSFHLLLFSSEEKKLRDRWFDEEDVKIGVGKINSRVSRDGSWVRFISIGLTKTKNWSERCRTA